MKRYIKKITYPSQILFLRVLNSIWRQKSRLQRCPYQRCLNGKLAVVTGGNSGIGYETSKGLIKRGAEVIMLAPNEKKCQRAVKKLKHEFNCNIHYIIMDLNDIESVINASKNIDYLFPNRKIDILIANAGIIPKEYSTSRQGFEKAFAVNVLGHHILVKACMDLSLFRKRSRIISVVGDIYILQNNCTTNYKYNGDSGSKAYSRSKLGCMWWAQELLRKHPELLVNIVHPGVVNTNFENKKDNPIHRFIREKFMITVEEGAQTTLICVTQSGIVNGAYYHNTMGQIRFPLNDPARNRKKSEKFWNTLEEIRFNYLNKSISRARNKQLYEPAF